MAKAMTLKVIFEALVSQHDILQIGGQESLGRGFVQTWLYGELRRASCKFLIRAL